MNPDQTPEAPPEVQETAADIFGDISNPAVEAAVTPTEPTGSEIEPVIPKVADFKAPEVEPPTHVDAPVVPVVPVATSQTPATPAPVQYTPEQLVQFQQWQAAQQQQVIPPAAVQPQHQPQAPRQEPQMSQADIDKALNKYVVSVDDFNTLFSEADPVKATAKLNDLLDKKVIQAVTMAHHLIQEAQSQTLGRVQPYMQFADTQREIMLREQFFANNADLKGQDLLIQTVMAQMAQERQAGVYKPQSEQQVFSDVATRTKALIAGMQQQGHTPASVAQGAQPAARVAGKPAMAVLPTGGGGSQSAANGSAAPGESQTARAIFA
jgi:hypothetical protein